MPDVTMPRLSDSMEEGTILKWLKAAGDEVAKGDELVEIETDKATMTYEADSDGTLEIVAEEGSTLSIGEVIARIGEGAAAASDGGASEGSEAEASAGGEDEAGDDGGGTATKTAEDEGGASEEEAESESSSDDSESSSDDGESSSDDGESSGDGADEAAVAEAEASAASSDDGGDVGGGAQAEAERAPAAEGNGGRPKASPVARRIAREHGIDLSTLEGTGPGGRIVKADVEAAALGGGAEPEAGEAEVAEPEAREAAPAETEGVPAEAAEEKAPEPAREKAPAGAGETGKGEVTVQEPSRIQQVIARRMAESKATIPHFTLTTDVDMEGAVELRDQLKALAAERETPVPSYNDMVVKACAIALRDFPLVNGAYRDGKFELYGRVNIGIAVAGEGTLIVPTVFDADRKGLGTIAKESRALAQKVRDGKISPPELSGATFSVTNLGMYGVTSLSAVINPPQSAILGVGKMEPRAVVRDGEVVARNTLTLTIACDHRILSGAPAAEFLARVKDILEQPISLAL
jgi:pyruvate dehydrogenase E2 component (dihydrolipoyllysine-residue acetyltransferase)